MNDCLALVVDDHPTNRILASALLAKLGWTASEAETGEQALALAATRPFRFVLLDISMPDASGEDIYPELRACLGSGARIVAYTAHAFPEERQRFLSAGFDDILVKPISRQQLQEVLPA